MDVPPKIRFDVFRVVIKVGVPAIAGPFNVNVVAATGNVPASKLTGCLLLYYLLN